MEHHDGPAVTLREEFTWRGYRHFTTADGLPNQTILALAQTADDRIYAGTDGGLARYDGVRWETVPMPVPRPSISALLADGDGLLVGTEDEGLYRLDPLGDVVTRIQASGLKVPMLDIVTAGDGRYFVDNEEVLRPGLDSLKEVIARVGGDNRARPVMLRADALTPHQAVVTAMDALGELGFTRLSIATTPAQAASAK